MSLESKLKDYFSENGIQMKWFAEKLGMPKQQLYQIVGGHAPLPDKYWVKMIKMTHGKITFCDILEDKLNRMKILEFKENGEEGSCKVSLRDFNTER